MNANVELKARLVSRDAARKIAQDIADQTLAAQHQIDTYFSCNHGRLKLREIDDHDAQLIFYQRLDDASARRSDYLIVPVQRAAALKNLLSLAWGIRQVVEKHREIYLWNIVRLHLDEVASLGAFLEFEAVLNEEIDQTAGEQQIQHLRRVFGITDADLVAGSYSDMTNHE